MIIMVTNILLKIGHSVVNANTPTAQRTKPYKFKGLGRLIEDKCDNTRWSIKILKFFLRLLSVAASGADIPGSSSNSVKSSIELSAKQRHDMDSNGLPLSEAIRNPNW